MPSSDSSRDALLEQLAEEFVERHRRGERPTLSEYAGRHPHLAAEIHDLFPALVKIEHLKPAAGDLNGDFGPASGPAEDSAPERLGEYRILRQVGSGGMGVVYEAEQESLGRHVALKVLPRQALLKATYLERFRREAKAAAKLHHTNIVPVFGVGECDGTYFYAMQFIRGEGLDKVLHNLRRLRAAPGAGTTAAQPFEASVAHSLLTGHFAAPAAAPAQEPAPPAAPATEGAHGPSTLSADGPEADYFRGVARVGLQVAEALAYAHRQGILHRDIKPSNLLLDQQGTVWITDFGLAKAEGADDLTQAGDIVGTIRYMAPERFDGRSLPQSDVYALGATLYELLTLRPAFDEANKGRLIEKVMHEPPVLPRRIDPRVPRDLETVVLKCLAKEPADRYATAEVLAEDLRRFLADRPIRARRTPWYERTWRWCRRNPVPAAAATIVLVVAVVAFALIADSRDKALVLARKNGELAGANGELAEKNKESADRERKQKEAAEQLAGDNFRLVKEEREQRKKVEWQLARETLGRGLELCDQGDAAVGALWLGRGLDQAARAEATDLERLARLNLAQWVSQLPLMRAVLRHSKPVVAAAFSPDGRTVLTRSKDGTARLWDVATGRPIGEPLLTPGPIWAVAFSPDGKKVVTGGKEGARLWDSSTGRLLGGPLATTGPVQAVSFSPDGRTLLTTSTDSVQLWETASGKRGGPPLPRGSKYRWLRDVAFRPDGKAVMMTSPGPAVGLWDPATGRPIGQPLAIRGGISAAAFSPDGRLLLTGSLDGVARLWLAETGKLLRELSHPDQVSLVAFSPDGRTLLTTARDNKAWLWDATTGKLIAALPHRNLTSRVLAAAFSPDGRAVLTGGGTQGDHREVFPAEGRGEARLWDVATGSSLGPPLLHPHSVECVAFSPDGRTFLTGNGDLSGDYSPHVIDTGVAWLWQAADPPGRLVARHDNGILFADFSRDGKLVATASRDNQVRLSNPATGETLRSLLVQRAGNRPVALSPDGRTLLAGTLPSEGGAQLLDVATGKPIGEPLPHPGVYCVAFSPDGKTCLTVGHEIAPNQSEARLWETATRRPISKPMSHRGSIIGIAWSHDGRTILTGGTYGAQLWDAMTGQAVGKPLAYRGGVTSVALSPDGKLALSGSVDGTARLCDAATGEPVGEELHHNGAVNAVAFSPDGQTALTGSTDGTARLWDAATGKLAHEPLHHGSPIMGYRGVAFSPDGRLLLTGGLDGTAQLWEASSGLPVGPRWRHQRMITVVTFSPDGQTALTADDGGQAWVWKVPALVQGPVPRVAQWPEVVTGRRLDPDRVVRLLTSEEWERMARQFHEAGRIPVPAFDPLDWHRREARACEARGQSFAAAWHLGRLIDAAPDQPSLYSRAIERQDRSAPAWFDRGHAYLVSRQWEKAAEDLSRVIDLDPDFGPAWHQRGYARAALGQWEPAARDLARAVGLPGVPAEALSQQALICLRLHDADGYRRACQALRAVPALRLTVGREHLDAVALAAWTFAVGPDTGGDPLWMIVLSPTAQIAVNSSSYAFLRADGAALYRANYFKEAVEKLNEAQETARRAGDEDTPSVWVLLAMAEHRLGKDPAKAREWLQKARDWIAAARKPAPGGAGGEDTAWDRMPWPEQLALELLEAEAVKLIEGEPQKK
jgi:WD40 repeat protein/serine/threonine protein kinase/tetratricopeptide (TPR) repeat protein